MNTLKTCGMLMALGFAATGWAQSQETPPASTPSTSQAEGTAADRTQPGKTPTREMSKAAGTDTAANPQPSTSETEGTAADRTPPGKTPTTSGTASTSGSAGQEMMGVNVVSSAQAPLGKVVDVVFDAKGQPEFVVISTQQGKAAAVPYETATAMKSGNKVVIEQSRLQQAPTVKEGEWRGRSQTWKDDSSRYWSKG